MNNHIKELAQQASELADKETNAYNDDTGVWVHTWNEVYDQKFAELIVRECARFITANSGYDDCNNAWFPEPEDLLAHFGVKE